MKRLIAISSALCLLLPAMVFAAPPDKGPPDGPTTKPAFGQQPVGEKPSKPGHGNHKPKPPPKPGNPGGGHKPGKPGGGGHHGRPPHKPPPNKPGKPPHRPGYQKPRPTQYSWRGKWFGRVRGPAFFYPHGYHYRIWYPGDRIPALFLTATYFYAGYAAMGLEIPPPGYRWVRYGPDLLLVNTHTYAVEDVVYGAFY